MNRPILGVIGLAAGLSTMVLFGPSGSAQQNPTSPAPGKAPSVSAYEVEAGPGIVSMATDGPAVRPNHPPFSQIPPAKMPDPSDPRRASTGPGAVIGRDSRTGRILQGTARQAATLSEALSQGGGYGGADGGGGQSDQLAGMSGPMSIISEAQRATAPWRMNVKLVAQASDGNFWVCSGTMRDAQTVLTAGHCVFDFGDTGWANQIWIYPGWDGANEQFAAPPAIVQPYGWANGTDLWSWTGWVNSGDITYDVGMVNVTRAVGFLTGWFGWSYGGDCAFWTSTTINNASYPAQACGLPGLHNGSDMTYFSGLFDSCPSARRLGLNTVAGCYTAIWGGQSGSGVYRIDGTDRFVHGITSTSNRTTYAEYQRQFQEWVEASNDQIIPNGRGAAFDLQPLDVNAGASTVVAGSNLTGLTHLAANGSNGAANANWTFRVYLSTNSDISAADTLLSTQNYNWAFGALSSVNINMVDVNIPGGTAPGNYYVGVIYDPATDGNDANDDSDNWDAVAITVTKPNLDMTLLTGPATAMPGQGINISNTVANIGNGATGTFRVGLYLSADATCTTADTFLGSRSLSLGAGGSSNANSAVTIPGGTTLGAKFLCGIADDQTDVFETNESDNTISAGITIVRPNLTVTLVNAPAQASPGSVVAVANTVANNGTAGAGAFRVGLYLSTDTTCTTGDTFLTSRNLASLAAGASSAVNTNVTIPAATPLSTRYVCVIADDLLAVAESNESDNTGSDSINVVSATPVITLKVNGLHPTPPNVPVTGPTALTLSISPTTYTGTLSWYWALVYNGSLFWVTSSGLSTTPAPFVVSPPVVMTDAPLLSLTLPPATTMTNAIFMVNAGGTTVASDFITATRP
jgi:CARDB